MSKDNAPDLNVSSGIKDLASKIKKDLKIGEGGTITVEKDFYQNHLPETISIADVQRIQAHDADFISAVGLAVGELAIDHMAKHKTTGEVTLRYKAGRDDTTIGVKRETQSVNPKDPKGAPLVKFGVLNTKVVKHGAKNSAGSWKLIREHLNTVGSNKLGK